MPVYRVVFRHRNRTTFEVRIMAQGLTMPDGSQDTTPATKGGLRYLYEQVGRNRTALSDWTHETTELAPPDPDEIP